MTNVKISSDKMLNVKMLNDKIPTSCIAQIRNVSNLTVALCTVLFSTVAQHFILAQTARKSGTFNGVQGFHFLLVVTSDAGAEVDDSLAVDGHLESIL
jgi:hypothetical protein